MKDQNVIVLSGKITSEPRSSTKGTDFWLRDERDKFPTENLVRLAPGVNAKEPLKVGSFVVVSGKMRSIKGVGFVDAIEIDCE